MGSPSTQEPGVREVKSAARTIQVLEFLAARGSSTVTIRELCRALDAPRSSVYALLKTLSDAGWVRTDARRATYGIGIRALLAGTTYLDADPRLQVVRPHLGLLGRQLGATVNLGRLDGTDVVYLATWEPPGKERPAPRVGRRVPAHATALGQAVLAMLSEAQLPQALVDPLARLTPQTMTSLADLDTELAAARHRGYAREVEQNISGVACIAVALDCFDDGRDALSVSIPSVEFTAARERDVAEALLATADVAAQALAGLHARAD